MTRYINNVKNGCKIKEKVVSIREIDYECRRRVPERITMSVRLWEGDRPRDFLLVFESRKKVGFFTM